MQLMYNTNVYHTAYFFVSFLTYSSNYVLSFLYNSIAVLLSDWSVLT